MWHAPNERQKLMMMAKSRPNRKQIYFDVNVFIFNRFSISCLHWMRYANFHRRDNDVSFRLRGTVVPIRWKKWKLCHPIARKNRDSRTRWVSLICKHINGDCINAILFTLLPFCNTCEEMCCKPKSDHIWFRNCFVKNQCRGNLNSSNSFSCAVNAFTGHSFQPIK